MTDNLYISETYVNATKGQQFGESGVYETFTSDKGELYRSLVREFGRCTGRVYVDREGKPPQTVGWVFLKRCNYEDTGEPYLREVWVTVHKEPPTITRTDHYADIGED